MNNCSTLALMSVVLPFAICVQAVMSPLVDPPGILESQFTPDALLWIGLSGIFAFLVNFSGFLVIGNISTLAHVLLGQLKTAIIMIGATFLFGSKCEYLPFFKKLKLSYVFRYIYTNCRCDWSIHRH